MITTPSMMDAFEALGIEAPECEECDGTGTITFPLGPHERTRDCDECRGTGRRLACPHCTDGFRPGGSDEVCETCEGYAALY